MALELIEEAIVSEQKHRPADTLDLIGRIYDDAPDDALAQIFKLLGGDELEQRIAVLEQQLAEARAHERECCALIAEGFEQNRDWVPGSLYANIRCEIAARIRTSTYSSASALRRK